MSSTKKTASGLRRMAKATDVNAFASEKQLKDGKHQYLVGYF